MKDIPTKADAKAELAERLTILTSGLNFLVSTQPGVYSVTGVLANEIISRIVTSERARISADLIPSV